MVKLSGLLRLIEDVPGFAHVAHQVTAGARERLPLIEQARAGFASALQAAVKAPILVVTRDAASARAFYQQAQSWAHEADSVVLCPDQDPLFYEHLGSASTAAQDRLKALLTLGGLIESLSSPMVVASARALMRITTPRRWLERGILVLSPGDRVELPSLMARLVVLGYRSAAVVQQPGEYARRGGIIDVYPAAMEQPARLELFGNEVETLRAFDPDTQRSSGGIASIAITPAVELVPGEARGEYEAIERAASLLGPNLSEEAAQLWRQDLERIGRGELFEESDFYLPFFSRECLLDWLPLRGLLILDDAEQVKESIEDMTAQAEEIRRDMQGRGELPDGFPRPYLTWLDIEKSIASRRGLDFCWPGVEPDDEYRTDLAVSFSAATAHAGRLRALTEYCQTMAQQGRRVVIVSQQARRLQEVFHERELYCAVQSDVTRLPPAGSLTLVHGLLPEGLQVDHAGGGLALLSDVEVFGWARPRAGTRRRRRAANPEIFVADLNEGDYVVHVEHGVARFRGLRQMELQGVQREYLVLEYAGDDVLYVPTDQSNRVGRYVAMGDHTPALHRLGSSDWQRTKERVKSAARDVARELLNVYASRELGPGHAFAADTIWQSELEASFPFVETPDQLEAIREVKRDMESVKPMDRLICGDVGYGKTEVALRAAFKAVNDGRQVAVLVPTTVLAQQHFNTFRERLQVFPVRVEVLSRFRSEREQKEVLEGLRLGTVDICIGTHRLIQADVEFRQLGLVIIDEEHRFGVLHKERLKQLRKEVDVLTLTATPIPRTLHMALVGVRDLSTMETPPEERLPVKTYVGRYKEETIREAILREMDRSGQVFFVHNRVQTIESVAQRLEQLVPEARFAVGHGQMPEEQLEAVMQDFVAGRYDVLVCSSIIESGLDIPNVNTIIVNQADRFGLAQLYQLRGRVGRSANRAYAYLLYGPDRRLKPLAERRLRTILEATELGSGFRIAMRDLEIRGAGNLLGVEQHGQVAAVGFDLYCQLLAEAVKELQGRAEQPAVDVNVDLPLKAYLPASYVSDEKQRLSLYQRLARATELDEAGAIALEMQDRFGPLPEPAFNLVYVVQTKALAARAGVASLSVSGDDVIIRMHPGLVFDRERLANQFGPILAIGASQLRVPWKKLGPRWMQLLQQVLESLGGVSAIAAPVSA